MSVGRTNTLLKTLQFKKICPTQGCTTRPLVAGSRFRGEIITQKKQRTKRENTARNHHSFTTTNRCWDREGTTRLGHVTLYTAVSTLPLAERSTVHGTGTRQSAPPGALWPEARRASEHGPRGRELRSRERIVAPPTHQRPRSRTRRFRAPPSPHARSRSAPWPTASPACGGGR